MVEDKRLRVDVAAIQELLTLHDINRIQWIPGHLQLANVMTKQGASGFHLLSVLQSGKMLYYLRLMHCFLDKTFIRDTSIRFFG